MLKKSLGIMALVAVLSVAFLGCIVDDTKPPLVVPYAEGSTVYDLAVLLTAIADGALSEAQIPNPLVKSGAATIEKSGGTLVVTRTANSWDGIDVSLAAIRDLIPYCRFDVTFTLATAPAATAIQRAPDAPYGQSLTGTVVGNTISATIPKDFANEPGHKSLRLLGGNNNGDSITLTGFTLTYVGRWPL